MPKFEIFVSTTIGRSVIVEAVDKGDAERRVQEALKNHELTLDISDLKDSNGNLVFDEDDSYSGASRVNVQPNDEAELVTDAAKKI